MFCLRPLYKKTLSVSFLALVPFSSNFLFAEEVWAYGVNETSGWYDVDKYLKYDGYTRYTPGSEVSSFCWAGATSNILTYWQKNVAGNLPASMPKSDLSKGVTASRDLFEIFNQNWSNKGGSTDRGIDWFLTGYDRRADGIAYAQSESFPLEALIRKGYTGYNYVEKLNFDASKTYSTGGFLNPTNQPSGYSTRYKFASGSGTGMENEGVVEVPRNNFNSLLCSILKNYGCFGLDLGGHALTCWGADFNEETRIAKSVWITDTDDCRTGIQKVDLKYTYMVQDPKSPNAGDIKEGVGIAPPTEEYSLTEIKLVNYAIYQVDDYGNTICDEKGNPLVNTETTNEFAGSSKAAITSFNVFTFPMIPEPSMFGLFIGLGSLFLVGFRRYKK